MVVGVAQRIHDPAAVPIGRPPSAPVLVRAVCVEDEPASFHLRIAELTAAATCHLAWRERQVHVLRRVAVDVINTERAAAAREISGGIGVGAALRPASALAARSL